MNKYPKCSDRKALLSELNTFGRACDDSSVRELDIVNVIGARAERLPKEKEERPNGEEP